MDVLLTSEFFWGVIVGVILTGLGGFFQVRLQSDINQKERLNLLRSFVTDTALNVQRIVADMEETRRRVKAIHPEFLALLDVEIGVFGRNREHIVLLPMQVRDKVRAYMNDCSLLRAEIGGGLAEFNRLTLQADHLLSAGNDPHSQRARSEANIPLQAANKALDRLVTRSRDAEQLIKAVQES